MRTVLGVARRMQSLFGRSALLRLIGAKGGPVAQVRPLAGGRRPLLTDNLGEQRRGGARLDQVDNTTCGSAVLIALAAWADPAETQRLDGEQSEGAASGPGGAAAASARAGVAAGFEARYDARQRQVHRESNRFWPQALGTTPWGMARWMRINAPAAGPYEVRLVDDTSAADVAALLERVGAALAAGRPVPLLVGPRTPRHYVMALRAIELGNGREGWAVYEPTSGEVRAVDVDLLRSRRLGRVLGFDRLHAALLPT